MEHQLARLTLNLASVIYVDSRRPTNEREQSFPRSFHDIAEAEPEGQTNGADPVYRDFARVHEGNCTG